MFASLVTSILAVRAGLAPAPTFISNVAELYQRLRRYASKMQVTRAAAPEVEAPAAACVEPKPATRARLWALFRAHAG